MFFYQQIPKLLIFALLIRAAATRAERLDQITQEALRNNPELRVLDQSIAAAKGGITTARTFANPELSAAPGIRRIQESGRNRELFHIEASLSQLLKFPGKRALEIAIAERNVELTDLAREAFRFQVAANVRRAYYEVLAGQKIALSRSEQAEFAKTFVASARKRQETGYGSDFEMVKSQAELIAAHKSLLQAQASVSNARITLAALMGRAPNAPLNVSGNLDKVQPPGSLADFMALALSRNPAIRTQVQQAELAGLNLRATRFARRPDVAIGPSLEYLDNEQTYGFGVTFALPLWDQKKGEIATATAKEREALVVIDKTRAEVAAEVAKAAANLESAKNQLALYSPAFLDNLKTFTARAEQGYAQNTTTLLIYLDAKRTYFDTLAGYYEAEANVAQNRAELESAVGVPLELKPL